MYLFLTNVSNMCNIGWLLLILFGFKFIIYIVISNYCVAADNKYTSDTAKTINITSRVVMLILLLITLITWVYTGILSILKNMTWVTY